MAYVAGSVLAGRLDSHATGAVAFVVPDPVDPSFD